MADNVSIRSTDSGSKEQTAQNRSTGGSFRDLLGFDPLRGFLPALTQAPGAFGVEINRTENGYTVEIPVPGFRPEQIDVTVQEDTVMVSGKSDRRNFTRTLILPEDIDPDGISANVDQGMLTLNLHQRPERQPRRITVQSGSAKTVQTIEGSSEPSTKEGSQQSTVSTAAAT